MIAIVFKKHSLTVKPWHNWIVNPALTRRVGLRFGWLWFDIEIGSYGPPRVLFRNYNLEP